MIIWCTVNPRVSMLSTCAQSLNDCTSTSCMQSKRNARLHNVALSTWATLLKTARFMLTMIRWPLYVLGQLQRVSRCTVILRPSKLLLWIHWEVCWACCTIVYPVAQVVGVGMECWVTGLFWFSKRQAVYHACAMPTAIWLGICSWHRCM